MNDELEGLVSAVQQAKLSFERFALEVAAYQLRQEFEVETYSMAAGDTFQVRLHHSNGALSQKVDVPFPVAVMAKIKGERGSLTVVVIGERRSMLILGKPDGTWEVQECG